MKNYFHLSCLLVSFSLIAMKKNPHEEYLKRYPKLHATYSACSTEGKLFLANLRSTAEKIKLQYPDFFKNGIQLFTIECRDGQISKDAINILQEYCPDNKKEIKFRGIDQFQTHVEQTKKIMNSGDVICDKFETYQLTEQDKKYANFVIALQVCHFVKNIELFVKKISQITQQDAIVLFAHSDDSQMSWAIKQISNQFRSSHITKDICLQLETAFKKSNVNMSKLSVKPTLTIPSLLPEIPKLEKVQTDDYDNQYTEHSESFHIIKNIFELGLDTPLESFGSFKKNWMLLPALKKNFTPENQLPLTTHIVVFDSASDELKKTFQ